MTYKRAKTKRKQFHSPLDRLEEKERKMREYLRDSEFPKLTKEEVEQIRKYEG